MSEHCAIKDIKVITKADMYVKNGKVNAETTSIYECLMQQIDNSILVHFSVAVWARQSRFNFNTH